ncbi:hypothetical protein D3C72_445070 [compost metagenome]
MVESLQDFGLDDLPFRPQRLFDYNADQPLDVGARRVMGAQAVALLRVQRALQQRAEDGRLNVSPVALGGGLK